MDKIIPNRKVKRISVTLDEYLIQEMMERKKWTGIPISRQLELTYIIYKRNFEKKMGYGKDGNGKKKYDDMFLIKEQ